MSRRDRYKRPLTLPSPGGRGGFHLSPILLAMAPLILAIGCSHQEPSAPPVASKAPEVVPAAAPAATRHEKVDVRKGPYTDTMLYVVKQEKPFVLVDMAPELARLKSFDEAGQEEYLLKRAVMIAADDKVLKHKEYAGKDLFVVRMILLTERDEYGRPKWGDAAEIALVEVPRAAVAGKTVADIQALDLDAVRKLFSEKRFTLENIGKAPSK